MHQPVPQMGHARRLRGIGPGGYPPVSAAPGDRAALGSLHRVIRFESQQFDLGRSDDEFRRFASPQSNRSLLHVPVIQPAAPRARHAQRNQCRD
ncbi:MAG TPA: hypothetical protein VJ783_28855 [Pirellulales bacterium]|nr:hypothetical protein [Pirellulales bacterium]